MGLRLAIAAAVEDAYREGINARDAALREARAENESLKADVIELGHVAQGSFRNYEAAVKRERELLNEIERRRTVAEAARTASENARAALGDIAPSAYAAWKWRHNKRGTTYQVIGEATVQAAPAFPLSDDAVVIIYRADIDGTLWVRAKSEFLDGRFAPIPLDAVITRSEALEKVAEAASEASLEYWKHDRVSGMKMLAVRKALAALDAAPLGPASEDKAAAERAAIIALIAQLSLKDTLCISGAGHLSGPEALAIDARIRSILHWLRDAIERGEHTQPPPPEGGRDA
jgi:hypothetical protein